MTLDAGLLAEFVAPTEDSRPFWEGCRHEQLLLQHCRGCSHVFYYARRLCPACGGTQLSWKAASGTGTVYSYSEVHVAFQGPHWQSQLPYCVVLIDLDEGPRMLSRWLAPKGERPAIGQRSRVAFVKVGDATVPFFAPEGKQTS